MASGSETSTQFWMDKLLQLNSTTSMSYNEALCTISDLENYVIASKEELNRLKLDVECKGIENKHKVELRDTLREFLEELKSSVKRVDELIKVKNNNVGLAKEIDNLRTQKALEKEEQDKQQQKQLHEVYRESMKIFESNPLVIQRNKLRNQINRRKFDILYKNQKISDLNRIYADLQRMEKMLEKREIIRFADAMVKYYKDQKEVIETRKNKEALNIANNLQEQTNELQVIVKSSQENFIAEPPKKLELDSFLISTNFNSMYNKRLLQNDTGLKNFIMQKSQKVGTPKLNKNQIQFPTLNLSKYQFDPAKYLKINTPLISKPEPHKHSEPPKSIWQNILNTPKTNLKQPTSQKFDYSFEKYKSKAQTEEKVTGQNKQKQELKRPSDTQESAVKPKITATVKNIQNINLTDNISRENEERIFLSQPENRHSQNEDKFISLSQDSQRSRISDSSLGQNCNLQKMTPKKTVEKENIRVSQSSRNNRQFMQQNQMFNLNTTTEKPQTNEVQKQIPVEHSKQPPMNQMFNLNPSMEKPQTNVTHKQNPVEHIKQPPMNQMFNLHPIMEKTQTTTETMSPNLSQNKISRSQMFNLQTSVPQKQNASNKQTMNQMFNLQTTASKNIEINEAQKQTPVENIPKSVNISNLVKATQPLETKSPYFVNQTIICSQDEQSLNTSAGHSEQLINVSSDQPPSEISVADISGEPMETDQIMMTEAPHMINYDYNNAGYNMMQFYEENPNMMQDFGETAYMSPRSYISSPNYVSPPDDIPVENQENNIPAANNMFGSAQNTGNSFFSFGQTQSNPGGSIFNMF